ncbi:hypothetical protein [Silvibacterium acidisoli]|uniref:hypothetical protein n=1 Tax=Acidobacteriaceae bacterium ZG23-2 TaxID=2883246 RepID=UPI00406CDA49
MKEPNLLGLVIDSEALNLLDSRAITEVLHASQQIHMPLMVVASEAGKEKGLLATITGNRVIGCGSIPGESRQWEILFSGKSKLLHSLDGVATRSIDTPLCALEVAQEPSVTLLASVRSGETIFPELVSMIVDGRSVFVAAPMKTTGTVVAGSAAQLQQTFSLLSSPLIFLRSIAGERAWQIPEQDANLTIDDPWLTEPYGNLEYSALLREMQQHHFHTTIAFVPWNFDRSQPQVSHLILDHPDMFSIAVHGNNHNHREFGAYNSQPLALQAENIQQSIARMDQFEKKTGIPYDKVMVFPHAIAPAETFALLEKAGFWATVNSENIPLGSSMPSDLLYTLRPWTLSFNGFLSVKRVSAEVPVSMPNIAINAFLGNPQLFYIHQEYFEKGIGEFSSTAEAVNQLNPGIHWRSLGDIVHRLYLERIRDDGDYDVCLLSQNVRLVNPADRPVTFHLFRPNVPLDASPSVLLNGISIPLRKQPGQIGFDVTLGPREERTVDVSYYGDRRPGSVDVSKKSFLINLDRRLSDFRDMQLSRSRFGRRIQDLYYKQGIAGVEAVVERRFIALAILFTGGLLLLFVIRRSRRLKAGTR